MILCLFWQFAQSDPQVGYIQSVLSLMGRRIVWRLDWICIVCWNVRVEKNDLLYCAHLALLHRATHRWDIYRFNQCRPWRGAAYCCAWSGPALFVEMSVTAALVAASYSTSQTSQIEQSFPYVRHTQTVPARMGRRMTRRLIRACTVGCYASVGDIICGMVFGRAPDGWKICRRWDAAWIGFW